MRFHPVLCWHLLEAPGFYWVLLWHLSWILQDISSPDCFLGSLSTFEHKYNNHLVTYLTSLQGNTTFFVWKSTIDPISHKPPLDVNSEATIGCHFRSPTFLTSFSIQAAFTVKGGYRMTMPENCLDSLTKLVYECWKLKLED